METKEENKKGLLGGLIRFCLDNKLVVGILILFALVWGIIVAPFDWDIPFLPRDPVAVDAIPDIGENQQIVFTEWTGRSPQDIEDQITYPLTTFLMGIPGVQTLRSNSMFGFSSIFIIFDEGIDFYWSRSRVLEKLSSLPAGLLPDDAQPMLGPDATALGQVFWYTLEGRDPDGNPTGGWDLHELRSIQDWHVRYALLSAEGVSEVASVGGFVQEYQVDVDPDAMRAYGVTLNEVFRAVKESNIDTGARTIELNRVEYIIRGLGFIRNLEDLRQTVIKSSENVPVFLKDVAHVTLGPALRRGALDKEGAEAVGGVVVVRYGENPLAVIRNVKEKIEEIRPGLPSKVLPDGTVSRVTIVPFYDRTGLIYETLGTLSTALRDQILVTVVVVLIFLMHLASSALISGLLPLSILMCFIAMKTFGVDANIVALSGIAIAIGTLVDMGIVLTENIVRRLQEAGPKANRQQVVYNAAVEVGSAVLTAVLTTIVSFLPVFTMTGPEGRLFTPLAFTKTFVMIAAIMVALAVIPAFAHLLFRQKEKAGPAKPYPDYAARLPKGAAIGFVTIFLTAGWLPLGPEKGFLLNLIFVILLIGGVTGLFLVFRKNYIPMLRWCLANKPVFLTLPMFAVVFGLTAWLGFDRVFSHLPGFMRQAPPLSWVGQAFPGLGREFMPSLDEGSYLLMPTTMPHASIGEAMDVLSKQDQAIYAIPEVERVVGKIGRAESPLDPAPVSMIETVIIYKPEYILDERGRPKRFQYNRWKGEFVRDEDGELIPHPRGRPYRQWRPHIQSPDDIWDEIVKASEIAGTTSAPKLQPIATRLVMLQTGMRAPMGVKVQGPDLETIERVGFQIESFLREVPSVEAMAVNADRVIGKPYLEIDIDREAIARYGVNIRDVQDVIETAIGGRQITTTVEGRERYPVRVRYMRELRDSEEALKRILVPSANGAQVPLEQLAAIRYTRGPEMIRSEDTFLTSYVLFDKRPGYAEVDVVEEARAYLREKIRTGELELPAGVSYHFAGTYEHQVRSARTLTLVLPVSLFIIFMILYLQFRSAMTTFFVFSGVFVAWSGGFMMLWLYGQPWFLDFYLFGVSMRDLFQINPVNLSVAVWVGFLALFGIATDDGVVMATYLDQSFSKREITNIQEAREATLAAAERRIRPALMTTATTILALLPVITSTGRGSDIMVPMAIPSFGGMVVAMITVFVVPVLYCAMMEWKLKRGIEDKRFSKQVQGLH